MSNAESVERMLASLPADMALSPLASMALTLAAEMDSHSNGGTSKSMIAKSMQDVLKELRELAPVEQAKDEVDDLRARRDARRAGSAAAEN